MCQHSRDGGNRCPVHRHDSVAIVKIATNESNLLPKQMENLFSELRREGRGAAAPTETEWKARLDVLERTVSDNADIGESVIAKLNKAREHSSLPDGATAYAQNLLVTRAKTRATNLDNKLREIALANGLTLAQARAKFVEEYNNVDRTRGADVPEEYTQMSRRRAVQAGIPYDKSTVVALARVAAASERGPRRAARVPATGSTYISEYGYNEDGGRFEIVFADHPETVFAYHNVPESVWERMNAGSAGSIYAREIRGNSEYRYDSAEEAEADAYQVRCTSCGQFRASNHACPRREASDELAEQGLDAAKIAEIVDVIHPVLIDNTLDQEPEENPAPTVADSIPAVVYDEGEIAEEAPAGDSLAADLEAMGARVRARHFAKPEPEAVEPVVEEPVFIPAPVGVLAENTAASNPTLTLHADAPIFEDHVPTPENQRHPKKLELPEGVELTTIREVDDPYLSIIGASNLYRLDKRHLGGKGFIEEELAEIKLNIASGIKYVIGYTANSEDDSKPTIIEKYDPKTHSLDVMNNGGWHSRGDVKSKYSIKRYGRRVVQAEPTTPGQKHALRIAETTRLEALVAENKAVVVEATATMTRKYKVDGNVTTNPKIAFGSATAFRRAIKEGKTVITKTSWELEGGTDGSDDQGYAYPNNGYRNQIEGEIAIRRNAAGVMEVVSSEHTLKCTCSDYRTKFYCEHINYVQRHLPNVAQQVMPAERTHRLLTASLAGRGDATVVDDGKTPAYISFGEEATLSGPGSSRAARGSWTPYHAMSIPAGVVSNYEDPTEEDIIAVATMEASYSQMRSVGAPPNLAGVNQALRRADVSMPVTAHFARDQFNGLRAGSVTGTMMLHRDADTGEVSVTGHTLKCTCAEYQENYDCGHVRLTASQPGVFLNIGARNMDIDRSISNFRSRNRQAFRREEEIMEYMRYNDMSRDDSVAAIAAEQAAEEERTRVYREQRARLEAEYRAAQAERERAERERIERENAPLIANLKTYRESMAKRWETQDEKYSDNPELFFNEHKEALARKRKGDVVIPFKVEGGVTDGVCAPVPGARQFGVELEFDIEPGVDRRTALKKIGRELHAAGLTPGPEQTYYHAAARNGYEKWSFEQDCTVDAELVSPIMSDTPEHWKELQTAVEIITRNGGKATTRCGSHVHVSTASYGASTAKHAELLRTVNQNEDVLYRLASDPSRGKHRGTRWCAPNVSDSENDVADDIQHGHNVLGSLESHNYGLNFEGTSKKQFMKSNIEFRMWDGTLDPAAIQQQVVVSAAITDYAERSVIENKGSKKPIEERRKIGHGKAKEQAALTKAGTKTHTAESFTEANSHVGEFLDKLFRRNEDKAGVAALFASTNWQADRI